MRSANIFLFGCFALTFALANYARADDAEAGKELFKQDLKYVIETAYASGQAFGTVDDCHKTAAVIRKYASQFEPLQKQVLDSFTNIALKSCTFGYSDKLSGERSLPMLLKVVDVILDSE